MREVGPELSSAIRASHCSARTATHVPPHRCEDPRALAGVSGGHFREVFLRTRFVNRAKSWTLHSAADAKRSATRSLQVASCLLHTLQVSWRHKSSTTLVGARQGATSDPSLAGA